MAEDRFLSVDEVAERYGVKPETVWTWLRDDKIPQPLRITRGTTRWRLTTLVAHEDEIEKRQTKKMIRRK